jgi:hypothetical protein
VGLVHDDGRTEELVSPVLLSEVEPDASNYPSLLGMDILQHVRLTVTGTESVSLEPLAELSGARG